MAGPKAVRKLGRAETTTDYSTQEGDWTPIPDPTRLTTQQLDRALGALREVIETRLAAMDLATALVAKDVARIADAAEALRVALQADVDRQMAGQREVLMLAIDRVRDITMAEITRVEAVANERFAGISVRFDERDERTAQAAVESRISLDAALAAAKEAVSEQNKAGALAIAKSEAATAKQADSTYALMQTNFRSLDEKIGDGLRQVEAKLSDFRDRLTSAETAVQSKAEFKIDNRGIWMVGVSMVFALIGAVGLVVSLVG